jgi:hypothetical protein
MSPYVARGRVTYTQAEWVSIALIISTRQRHNDVDVTMFTIYTPCLFEAIDGSVNRGNHLFDSCALISIFMTYISLLKLALLSSIAQQ